MLFGAEVVLKPPAEDDTQEDQIEDRGSAAASSDQAAPTPGSLG